jgi:hypothetical protein
MKKLLALVLFLLLGVTLHAQKHSSKKQMLSAPTVKKEKANDKQPAQDGNKLDPNTRGWLHEIRVKIYGFDMDKKKGKGGC